MQVMREEEPGRGDPIGPLNWLEIIPFEPAAASDHLGWVGLEAVHFRTTPATEFNQPANTHHLLVLYTRPPEEMEVRYEGVKRYVPPPARPGCARAVARTSWTASSSLPGSHGSPPRRSTSTRRG